MKGSCDNVWAVVEIIGPKEGFDCTYFNHDGGTQYRTGNPLNSTDTDNDNDIHGSNGSGSGSGTGSGNSSGSMDKDKHTGSNYGNGSDSSSSDSQEGALLDVVELRSLMSLGPSVTVRMLPSAIPDTRNFE